MTNIYKWAIPNTALDTTNKVKMERGLRLSDTLSLKLFTSVLKDALKRINWNKREPNVDGDRLTHLMYADEIVIFGQTKDELDKMPTDIYTAAKGIGLEINFEKTKYMTNQEVQEQTDFLGDLFIFVKLI